MKLVLHSAAAARAVTLKTIGETKLSKASENTVRMPYINHFWNSGLVWSKIRQRMNKGPRPTTKAMAKLYIRSMAPTAMGGLAVPKMAQSAARAFWLAVATS